MELPVVSSQFRGSSLMVGSVGGMSNDVDKPIAKYVV